MIIRAQQKYIRQSPRKLSLVVDAIRGLTPQQALEQLTFLNRRAAPAVAKVIKQAIANAKNQNLGEDSLKFNRLEVNEGPTFKRWQAVSRGRAHQILKRTSHLSVFLESIALTETDALKSKAALPKQAGATVPKQKQTAFKRSKTSQSNKAKKIKSQTKKTNK